MFQGEATQVLDLNSQWVFPGLIDTHVHLMSWVAKQDEDATKEFGGRDIVRSCVLEELKKSGVSC